MRCSLVCSRVLEGTVHRTFPGRTGPAQPAVPASIPMRRSTRFSTSWAAP
jgi:hypothetical protein